uniref:Uncharacterized protein n=1 Tax=Helianthus annuus TaxID=4232 RepID=A0A251U9F5_HELAN
MCTRLFCHLAMVSNFVIDATDPMKDEMRGSQNSCFRPENLYKAKEKVQMKCFTFPYPGRVVWAIGLTADMGMLLTLGNCWSLDGFVHKYYSEDVDVKMERPAEESALEFYIQNTVVADLKERLLPPKPASATNHRETSYRPSASGRQPFQGVDVLGLKKRGQGLRSWIRVDAATGDSQIIEVDKFTIMRRCDLPARDLRLLDPLFVYLSTILGREKFIVVNLEQIRCIITADEVLLLNSLDSYVLQYVVGCNGN